MKLIDKDALVAEIEKRYEYWREKEHNSHSIESEIRMSECQHLMLLLNTLEVKEVDLEEEINRVWDNTSDNFTKDDWKEFEDVAKHFFELGMQVIKQKKEKRYDRV